MNERYILEWLDTVITVTLNPVKTQVSALQPEDIRRIMKGIGPEKTKIMGAIKLLVFSSGNEAELNYFIKLYHTSLVVLLDQAVRNQAHQTTYPALKPVFEELVICVDELIHFLERRFSAYLVLNERLPIIYLSRVKAELNGRIRAVEKKLKSQEAFQLATGILVPVVRRFLNQAQQEHELTFQEISYIKDLFQEVENLESNAVSSFFSVLDERLIYMNFNHRLYADYLLQRLNKDVSNYKTSEGKMEYLLVYAKAFRQLPRKPDAIFSGKYPDLTKVLLNWFRHEISYLEKSMRLSIRAYKTSTKGPVSTKPKQKVVCALSSDQTGLILRAADELRILVGRSMNEVFKTIVPHLSSPYKENLSYDGMRSKSYVPEERDKQKAIDALQRIIKKIEEY
ncbi:hypothetical protein [Gaoshiqia sp. Z1-71]|uniref:hypothetical protein n=1 Tax=Gaoshiqia hydrogeniformans TaxID=3290090 RepID=UPI003BF914FE